MERGTTPVNGGPRRDIERRRDHSRNQDDKINPEGSTYWPSQQPRGPRASQSGNTTYTANPREGTTQPMSRGRDMTGTRDYAERTRGESQHQGRVGYRASIEQQWRPSIPLPIRTPTTRDQQDTSFPPYETAQSLSQAPDTAEASGYGGRSRPVTRPQDQIREWLSREEEHVEGTVGVPEQAHTRLDISATSREAARDTMGRSSYSRRSRPEPRPQAQDREQVSTERARNTMNRSSYSGQSQPEPRPQVRVREQLPSETH